MKVLGMYSGPVILVLVVLLLLLAGSAAEEASSLPDWRALIISGEEAHRIRSEQIVLVERGEEIDFLLSVLTAPVKKGEPFYSSTTSRNIAMRLLGEMRAKEAVPDLVDWLVLKEGQGSAISELMIFSPAGYALAEIGLPSVPPLLQIIQEKGCSSAEAPEKILEGVHVRYKRKPGARMSPLGDQCLKIIVRIKGVDQTGFSLQRAIEGESDETKKQNLESALELLRAPTFPASALERARLSR